MERPSSPTDEEARAGCAVLVVVGEDQRCGDTPADGRQGVVQDRLAVVWSRRGVRKRDRPVGLGSPRRGVEGLEALPRPFESSSRGR